MIGEFFRKLFGIRNDEEDFAAGADYVRKHVRLHGADNKYEMDRLWTECDGAICRTQFDRGMVHTLIALRIPDPQDGGM